MEYRILRLERRNNSVNGNPKYEVYYEGEHGELAHATTQSDAAFCYGIANDMYTESNPRVMATLQFSKSGRITDLTVTRKQWGNEYDQIQKRLRYLRRELRAARMSYEEVAELQGLAAYIADDDVELLEAAGVPEGLTGREWLAMSDEQQTKYREEHE